MFQKDLMIINTLIGNVKQTNHIITSLVNTKEVLPRWKRSDRDGIIHTCWDGSHFVVIRVPHHVGNADGQIV